ncbi:hypothetical protein [Methyloglobulus sp.]|uniref:hypothetical protein n=1 Tax=Methyloglobulus sp. TaxID=2518622 RepID=UPI0032B807C8
MEVKKKSRKAVNQDHDKKRIGKPCINVIRDVPEDIIAMLEVIAKYDGSKKAAILRAIKGRYEKISGINA